MIGTEGCYAEARIQYVWVGSVENVEIDGQEWQWNYLA